MIPSLGPRVWHASPGLALLIVLALLASTSLGFSQVTPAPVVVSAPANEQGGNSRPNPDPTVLTTALVDKAIATLKEALNIRFDSLTKEIDRNQKRLDDLPPIVDSKIGHLQILTEEKFAGVQVQFKERDTRTVQSTEDSKVAIAAALQAQKEAVANQNASTALTQAKSDANTTKQIDSQLTLITAVSNQLGGKIDDLKARIGLVEGKATGGIDSSQSTLGFVTLAVSILSFMGMLGVGIFAATRHGQADALTRNDLNTLLRQTNTNNGTGAPAPVVQFIVPPGVVPVTPVKS